MEDVQLALILNVDLVNATTKMKKGLVQIYTGNGKGKTTASLGLAMRAAGQGFNVYIIQFLKGGNYTGELLAIKQFLPNSDIVQFGKGCVQESKQLKISNFGSFQCKKGDWKKDEAACGDCRYCFENDNEQEQFVKDALNHAKKITSNGNYDLVVLDELNCAISSEMIKIEDALDLIKNKNPGTELIITGRDAHEKIIEAADLVSEIKEIKHYYKKGVQARRGIEY